MKRYCIDCLFKGVPKETRGPYSDFCVEHGEIRDNEKREKGLAKARLVIMFGVKEEKIKDQRNLYNEDVKGDSNK